MMLSRSFYYQTSVLSPEVSGTYINARKGVGRLRRVGDTSSNVEFTYEPKLTADELFQRKDMSEGYFPHQTRPLGSPGGSK